MYAVAVAKCTDLTSNLWNLRGKTICSTAMGDLAGEYFGQSCVPGSLDYDYNKLKTNPRALCLRCYA
ncbi:unnamed protein product [Rotaria sp. Silwood1]|nr:unnamed protein product [Rotaria sp. Silwood1]CAF1519085.1 unnamed protein product [Rotaria sp. Silwood1]